MLNENYPGRLRELSLNAWLSEIDAAMLEEAANEIEKLQKQLDLYKKAAEMYERGAMSDGDRLLDEARRA